MKTDLKTAIALLLIFIITIAGTVLFAIYILSSLSTLNVKLYNSPTQSLIYLGYLIFALLIGTALTLLAIKRKMFRLMRIIFILVSGLILLSFFSFILPAVFAIAAAVVVEFYYYKYAGQIGRDVVNILIFISVGSIIALDLGFLPSVVLTAVIAVYDYIAVFKTKHMITLANGIKDMAYFSAITLAAIKRKAKIMIGGGDLIFPAVLVTATFLYSPIAGFYVFIGAVAGLAVLLLTGQKKKAYPAMSFIGPAELIALGVFFLISAL
ncbi:MAG: presenilin family intramembrane aspartyl protease [Candidatus Acidifodinimicrobium sp.]